ncbi:MAG TPA: DNA polymerase, partial [Solirubrobacterales bacterium]|nr:DNA polymerase [Solirubrobacterales bacterium]
ETLARRYELRRLLTWAEKARAERRQAAPAPAPAERAGLRPDATSPQQAALDFSGGEPEFPAAFGPEVRILARTDELRALAAELAAAPAGFCVDTETTSEDAMRARLVGLGLSIGGRPAYVPLRHKEGANARWSDVASLLGPLLADAQRPKVGQHLKYDTLVLKREGLPLQGLDFDTLIASYLIEPDGAHGLDHLSRVHLGVEKIPTSALLGARGERTMDEVAIARVAAYCGEDVHCTWLLRERLAPRLEERALGALFRDVEMRLVPVLVDMEFEGVRVDAEFLAAMSERLGRELNRLEVQIHAAAGGAFNVNSGPQLAAVLFEKLGLPARAKTKTGLSTSADVLEELAAHHALPGLVLQYRQLAKLKSTYVDALPALVHPETGRVHTQFHQTVAATGRLSSSNPGL